MSDKKNATKAHDQFGSIELSRSQSNKTFQRKGSQLERPPSYAKYQAERGIAGASDVVAVLPGNSIKASQYA